MAHKWLHLQNYLLQAPCRTSQLSVCVPVVPWDCCSSQGCNWPGTGGWTKGQLLWGVCGGGEGKSTCSSTLDCNWQWQPMENYKKGVRDVLRVQGKKKEGVKLEEAFIHNFMPFPPSKDHCSQKEAILDATCFQGLACLWGFASLQSLTVPTTTPCLSSAHPWLGKGQIPPLAFPTPGFWWSQWYPKLCCSVTLPMTD